MRRVVLVAGVLGALVAPVPSRALGVGTWIAVPAAKPTSGGLAAMAYDAERGETVLFGGHHSTAPIDETWTWDGVAWTRRWPSTSPPARHGAAMTYDARRERVVLFGGTAFGGQEAATDTWEWDGATWTNRTPAVSPPNWGGQLAFDDLRGVTVLFTQGQTWEWDGSVWTRRFPASSPPVRYAYGLAFDAGRGRTVLFGGMHEMTYLSDTWEWDGTNWSLSTPLLAPPPNQEQAMVYDAARGRIVLFSGILRDRQPTWEWDGTLWTRVVTVTAPVFTNDWVTGYSLAYDSRRARPVLYIGSVGTSPLPHTWELVAAP